MKSSKRLSSIALLATAVHALIQFFCWSFADAIHGMPTLWEAVSFPVFWIFPKAIANVHFWLVFFLNSFVWGLLLSFTVQTLTTDPRMRRGEGMGKAFKFLAELPDELHVRGNGNDYPQKRDGL